jgi:DNA-binding transcriptional MocR family regulator
MWISIGRPGAEELAQRAAREGVVIATGSAASVTSGDDRHIRLCFDRPEQQLVEGVDRLVRAWRSMTG